MPQCKHSLWLIEYRGFSTAVKSHDRMLIKTKTTRTVMLIMKKIGRMLMTKIGRMLMLMRRRWEGCWWQFLTLRAVGSLVSCLALAVPHHTLTVSWAGQGWRLLWLWGWWWWWWWRTRKYTGTAMIRLTLCWETRERATPKPKSWKPLERVSDQYHCPHPSSGYLISIIAVVIWSGSLTTIVIPIVLLQWFHWFHSAANSKPTTIVHQLPLG